jgi:hypothetical protein
MIVFNPKNMAREILEFDLTPSPELMTSTGIGSTNLGLGFALGEIIANSLDWSLLSKQEAKTISEDASQHADGQKFLSELENEYGSLSNIISDEPPMISIESKNGKIIIVDKGVGMTFEEVQTAMQLKRASDKIRAPLRMRKGQFGMGLKVSALGLGRTMEIQSRSIKTPGQTIVFEFKDKEMEGRSGWTSFPGYRTEDIESDSPLGSQQHGTAIVISDLNRNYNQDDVLDAREALCEIFHYAIQSLKAEIRVNGALLVATEPEMNPDVMPLVLDDFDLFVREDLGGGRRGKPIQIRGWAGVMTKTMSGDLKYGFHTFRKNQLIEMNHNDGYRANPSGLWPYPAPHAELARLFGHIHLDMVPPNFHKKGWNNDSEAWADVVEVLKPVLEPLVKLARDTTKDVKKNKDLLGAYTRFAKTGDWKIPNRKPIVSMPKKGGGEEPIEKPPEPKTAFNLDGYDYDFLTPIQGSNYDESKPPWTFVVDHSSHEIQMTLYMQHPLFTFAKADGSIVLSKIAQIDVFCQMMQDKSYSIAEIQSKRESLYRTAFGG